MGFEAVPIVPGAQDRGLSSVPRSIPRKFKTLKTSRLELWAMILKLVQRRLSWHPLDMQGQHRNLSIV